MTKLNYSKSSIVDLKAKTASAIKSECKEVKSSGNDTNYELPETLKQQSVWHCWKQQVGEDDDIHPLTDDVKKKFADALKVMEQKYKNNKWVEKRRRLLSETLQEAVRFKHLWNASKFKVDLQNKCQTYMVKNDKNKSAEYMYKILDLNLEVMNKNVSVNTTLPVTTYNACQDYHLCQLDNPAKAIMPNRLWPRIMDVKKYQFYDFLSNDKQWASLVQKDL